MNTNNEQAGEKECETGNQMTTDCEPSMRRERVRKQDKYNKRQEGKKNKARIGNQRNQQKNETSAFKTTCTPTQSSNET